MAPHTTHGGTRNKILGAHPSPALEEMCSAERQVTEQAPPVFLVHALDDGVSCANSRLMEQACREKGVPASLNFYPTGGHGYGMENADIPRINGLKPPNNGSGNRDSFLPRLLPAGVRPPERALPPEHGGNECARTGVCRTAGLTGTGPGGTFSGHECARKELQRHHPVAGDRFPHERGSDEKRTRTPEKWEDTGLYERILSRRMAQGAPRFLLHDGPPSPTGTCTWVRP